MKFTEAEYARQRDANRTHELEQRIEELKTENAALLKNQAEALVVANDIYCELIDLDGTGEVMLTIEGVLFPLLTG